MIDWIKAVIPLAHAKRICGGIVQSLDPESGEVEWQVHKRQKVEGSHSSTVQVRTIDAGHIEIDGNPSKFLQGQNVFGSNDLLVLCTAFFQEVVACLGLPPSELELARWKSGLYDLKRVDVAECFRLPSQEDVAAWLRAATGTIRGKHQTASAYAGETIYLGQRSRRISLKAYNKYREVLKHPPATTFPYAQQLLEHSKPLLRLEVRVLATELKRRNLHIGERWHNESVAAKLMRERISMIKLNQRMRLTSSEVDDLPPRLRAVYRLWVQGEDPRGIYPKATFYRYRTELLKHCKIDISVPQPRKAEVIPLVRFLTAEHVSGVPDWAEGTEAYFDPDSHQEQGKTG